MLRSMQDLPAPELPSLDYAFLADFATVNPQGTLTAVGASFTYMQTHGETLPLARQIAIAGRLRIAEGTPPVEVTFTFKGPGEEAPELKIDMVATHGEERPYEGRVGILFAVNTPVPIMSAGLHRIWISIDGEVVRMLAFTVEPVD